MAFGFSPKIITDGLVMYLDAANSNSYISGSTTWRDISKTGNNGTLTNGPGYSSINGGTITFDGADDAVIFSSGSIDLSTADFSIEFWFYRTGTSQAYARYFQLSNGDNYSAASITINNTSQDSVLSSVSSNGTSWNVHSSAVGNFNFGSWNHFVMSRNSTSINYYINKNLSFSVSNVPSTLYYTASQVPVVGGQTVNAARTLAGRIPIVRVYKGKGLSATEVLQNYNAQKSRFGLT